jgi:hypothetical protein
MPVGRRLASDRQGHGQDRGIDDEGPGRAEPPRDLVVDEVREAHGRVERERLAGLRLEVGLAAARDEQALGGRAVRVLQVAAQGAEHAAGRGRQCPRDPVDDVALLLGAGGPHQPVGPAEQDAGRGGERLGRGDGVTRRAASSAPAVPERTTSSPRATANTRAAWVQCFACSCGCSRSPSRFHIRTFHSRPSTSADFERFELPT